MNDLEEITQKVVDKILSFSNQKYLLRFEEPPAAIRFWQQLNDEILSNHNQVEVYIHRNKGKWKNLNFLQYLSNLRRLNINSSDIIDISGLKFTPNLVFLRLDSLYLQDYHPIENLNKLTDLYLGSSESVVSLSIIESLHDLIKLQIWGQKKDFHFLQSTNVRFLTIEDIPLEENIIEYLNAMRSLEKIGFDRSNISDWNMLKQLNEEVQITLL